MTEFVTEATRPIPAGEHQVRMEFAYDGGGLGKGGTVTLFYDGDKVGEGRVEATQPLVFSADETTDIGEDFGMPVSSDYTGSTSRFNGKIDWCRSTSATTTTTTWSIRTTSSASPCPGSR